MEEARRLTSVDGAAAFGGVTNYAASPDYRAWGGLQSLTYGDGLTMTMSFNNRLQADSFRLTNATQTTVMDKSYEYYADGKLRKLDDLMTYPNNNSSDLFDRTIKYDHVGRPVEGKSGAETRGGTVAPEDMEFNLPYRQSYKFNAFGNMTQRLNTHWGKQSWGGKTNNLNYTYQNNRITNYAWEHDADGRVTQSFFPDDNITSTYDAAGRLTKLNSESNITQSYDGNSKVVKRATETYSEDQNGNGTWTTQNKYFIRSGVTGGQTVSEVDATGKKTRTIVRAAGVELAWQDVSYGNSEYVFFQHNDASGMSYRTMQADGTILDHWQSEGAPAELDPLGGNVGVFSPYFQFNTTPITPEKPTLQNLNEWSPRGADGQRVRMMMDGIEVPYWIGATALANGSAIPASLAEWQGLPGFSFEPIGLGMFKTTIPDVWATTSGRWWTQAPGTPGDGNKIFSGGTFIVSVETDWERYSRVVNEANKGKASANDLLWAKIFKAFENLTLVKNIDQTTRDNILKNKSGEQSDELALCHAAQESEFRMITDVDGNTMRPEGAQGELGLFQIKYATAIEVVDKLFSNSRIPSISGLLTPDMVRNNDGINTTIATLHLQNLIDNRKESGREAIRGGLAAYNLGESKYNKLGLIQIAELYADAVLNCESLLQGVGL